MDFQDDDFLDFGTDDDDSSNSSPIGNTTHDERGDFDLGDANPEIDPDYNFPARDAQDTRPNPNSNGDDPKKVAIIGIAMGLIILFVCFGIYAGYKAYQNNKAKGVAEQRQLEQYIEEMEETDQYSKADSSNIDREQELQGNTEPTNEITKTTPTNTNTTSQTSDSALDGWVKFNSVDGLNFENSTDSNFTITNIEYFAKVVNSQNDKIVKCILNGNISGLIGTYEIEIPYSQSIGLKLGDILNIRYTYHIENNVMILGEIIFI